MWQPSKPSTAEMDSSKPQCGTEHGSRTKAINGSEAGSGYDF